MNFIYHAVPQDMIGHKLIPLNQMQGSLAKTRLKHLRKYNGREAVLERKIPLLNCLWNDVVQLLPLHPQKVFDLQKQLGLITQVPPYKFYEINLSNLDPNKSVVFFKTAPGEENTHVEWLSKVNINSLQQVPEATIAYYKTLVGSKELPFNYQFIPHIFYNDSVDISNVKIVSLKNNK